MNSSVITGSIVCILLIVLSSACIKPIQKNHLLLERTCELYSENWQGLFINYSKGKDDFLKKCMRNIDGQNLLSGLWSIRAMLPDGHAGFSMDQKQSAQIYPLVFVYDSIGEYIKVGAVFQKALQPYIGKRVRSINGQLALTVVQKRAALEPQSTILSSIEIAARTLTISYNGKPYIDFSSHLGIDFDDDQQLFLLPLSLVEMRHNNYVK